MKKITLLLFVILMVLGCEEKDANEIVIVSDANVVIRDIAFSEPNDVNEPSWINIVSSNGGLWAEDINLSDEIWYEPNNVTPNFAELEFESGAISN